MLRGNKKSAKMDTISHIDGASGPADGFVRAIAIFGGRQDQRSLRQHQLRLGMGNLHLQKRKGQHLS
jgi:hypothetical protein